MIPKIIHYCWFGRGKKSELALKCIESWKKYCPDYEFMEWSEDNFDICSNTYVKEAYESKKYAFVTDYVRLYALLNYGGIYMDTDVELVGNLDRFLDHQAFSGFEEDGFVPTGLMASEKGFSLFKELIDYYKDAKFILEDGSLNTTTNTFTITKTVEKYGLEKNGKFQVIEGFALYPKEYFCPLNDATGKVNATNNTVAIHWFSKSWMPRSIQYRSKITRIIHRIFGENSLKWVKKIEMKIRNR